jgi:hypothetical protein
MQIIDAYADKMGYTKNTPIHLIPETEEVIVQPKEEIKDIKSDTYMADNINDLLADITTRIALVAPEKGAKFFSEFIYNHQSQTQTQRSKKENTIPMRQNFSPLSEERSNNAANYSRSRSPTSNAKPESYSPRQNRSPSPHNKSAQTKSTHGFLAEELQQRKPQPNLDVLESSRLSDKSQRLTPEEKSMDIVNGAMNEGSLLLARNTPNAKETPQYLNDQNRMFAKPVNMNVTSHEEEKNQTSYSITVV